MVAGGPCYWRSAPVILVYGSSFYACALVAKKDKDVTVDAECYQNILCSMECHNLTKYSIKLDLDCVLIDCTSRRRRCFGKDARGTLNRRRSNDIARHLVNSNVVKSGGQFPLRLRRQLEETLPERLPDC